MTRAEIINGLWEKGYDTEEYSVVKNGVLLNGIIFKENNPVYPETEKDSSVAVSPIIYTDELIKKAEITGETIEEVISVIIDEYERNKYPDINYGGFYDRDYILKNIFIRVQHESNSNDGELTKGKCMFDGLESLLHVRFEILGKGYGWVKVNDVFLGMRGIEINEAWEHAEKNTMDESILVSVWSVLNSCLEDMFGREAVIENEEYCADCVPLYVLTNKQGIYGASAIYNRKLLMEFAEKFHTDRVVVLPSSIHEMLLIPFEYSVNIQDLTVMVHQINSAEVKPEDRLGDRIYIVDPFNDRENMTVTY